MQKIAVGKSIARAYGFLLGRIFPIVGLAWLPALIYAALQFHVLQNLAAMLPGGRPDPSNMLQVGGFLLGVGIAGALLRATIAISLTQDALGVRKDLALAHLVIGPRELRLFLAAVRLLVIFAVGYGAWGAALAFSVMQATRLAAAGGPAALVVNGHPLLPFVVGIVAFLVLVTFLLAMLRLSFLIVPVAAVEHQASLMRSWSLTSGSAWRIVAIFLGTVLPVAVVTVCAIWFLTGDALSKAVHDMTAVRPVDPTFLFQFYAAHALLLVSVGAAALIVVAALQAGAMSAAYRTVTGHDEEEHDDDDALVTPLIAPADVHHDDAHGHGGHDDHGQGGLDDNGHGDEHRHGGHDDHGHDDNGQGGGHDDHGHDDHRHAGGGHDDQAHGGGHDDHGHSAHNEDVHGGRPDHGGDAVDGQEHGDGHDDDGHGGHDDHGNGDHGHGSHHSIPASGVLDAAGLTQDEREAA